MQDVFSYIQSEEHIYTSEKKIPIVDGYEWSMHKHVRLTTLYLNSQFETGGQEDKPFKNIILPKVNVQHRAVEFDVKDIEPYVNDPKNYYKSFLVKKKHETWARENDLDDFLDEMTETWLNYGGVIVKNVGDVRPEVVPFNRIAFCDQTDLNAGPICEKHYLAPDQLRDMEENGWGRESNGATATIDDVIRLAAEDRQKKETDHGRNKDTPGHYIEVYELNGVLPKAYLEDDPEESDYYEYTRQKQLVTFYKDQKGHKHGLHLFRKEVSDSPHRISVKDPIPGRALGRGAVEELFEPQVWTNYSAIHQKRMLDQASKIMYQSIDSSFAGMNTTKDVDNGHVFTYKQGPLERVDNTPPNYQLFEQATQQWDQLAQEISSAFPTIQGDQPSSGTPFRLGALQNQEAHSLHKYRRKKLAKFTRRLYRDWFLKHLSKVLQDEDEFMANLDQEEMQKIADQFVTNRANRKVVEKILNGEQPSNQEVEDIRQELLQEFNSSNTKFFKIFKDELGDIPTDVFIHITGENRDNALVAEKLSSVFSQVAQSQQPDGSNVILDDPRMARLFNQILEASGISPIEHGAVGVNGDGQGQPDINVGQLQQALGRPSQQTPGQATQTQRPQNAAQALRQ